MIILGIETSCDETAVCVVDAKGGLDSPTFNILGNGLFSQVALHAEYGGVYPNLAKREHAKNLPSLLQKALSEASLWQNDDNTSLSNITEIQWKKVEEILSKEYGLFESFRQIIEKIKRPKIDMISVTAGPGLEPALWVGISFAKALSEIWDIPVIATNHMEGHISSVLLNGTDGNKIEDSGLMNNAHPIQFPTLALLISGGHTELVEIKNWGEYKKIGQTRDDAVGEAFDKVARMLKLPYPGGPEVSKLAQHAREQNLPNIFSLPRPMIHSKDFDFSFSGLKTSILYTLRDYPTELNSDLIADLCREFENAVTEVLVSKTKKALEESAAKTLIIAGGVVANTHIRKTFFDFISKEFSDVTLQIPSKDLATDNAIMISSAGYIESIIHPEKVQKNNNMRANGNMNL
ncbi:MAG: tRNA (adenosine(37)-N6)-threonylcarbamoyltransferase complex transferase subunit TsaD [Minisyncoccota bacterium]